MRTSVSCLKNGLFMIARLRQFRWLLSRIQWRPCYFFQMNMIVLVIVLLEHLLLCESCLQQSASIMYYEDEDYMKLIGDDYWHWCLIWGDSEVWEVIYIWSTRVLETLLLLWEDYQRWQLTSMSQINSLAGRNSSAILDEVSRLLRTLPSMCIPQFLLEAQFVEFWNCRSRMSRIHQGNC